MRERKNERFSLRDLCFYFDALERDRLDSGRLGRKNGQVIALREKLLSLPESDFDVTIKTMEKLVQNAPSGSSAEGDSATKTASERSLELFASNGTRNRTSEP